MASATLDDLELDVEHAEALIAQAIEYGAYSDDMPKSKKDKMEAATEIIAFSIDAYVNDGVRPDDADEGIADSGEKILELLSIVGIEFDEDDDPVFGEMPELEGDEDEEEEDDEDEEEEEEEGDEDEEAAFDPDDYFEGYTDATNKVKFLKEYDLEDEDVQAGILQVKEWEEAQDKPSSRVLNWIEETFQVEGDEEEEEESEEEEDEDGDDAEDDGPPWEGYDKATAVDIKKVLQENYDEGELEEEQVKYVLAYEEARKAPRKRVIDFCNGLLEQLAGNDDADEDEEEEEEKPAKGKAKSSTKAKADKVTGITITRAQILEALDKGSVTL